MSRYVGALDQGTTSTRFFIFDNVGATVASAQMETRQIYPQPGWVEQAAAYQTRDVVEVMEQESGIPTHTLRVDGGMTMNNLLIQFQSDILDVPVVRPRVLETTALGAACAAGLAVGYWQGTDDLVQHWAEARRWEPAMDQEQRAKLTASWEKAVARSFDWV